MNTLAFKCIPYCYCLPSHLKRMIPFQKHIVLKKKTNSNKCWKWINIDNSLENLCSVQLHSVKIFLPTKSCWEIIYIRASEQNIFLYSLEMFVHHHRLALEENVICKSCWILNYSCNWREFFFQYGWMQLVVHKLSSTLTFQCRNSQEHNNLVIESKNLKTRKYFVYRKYVLFLTSNYWSHCKSLSFWTRKRSITYRRTNIDNPLSDTCLCDCFR